MFYAHFVLSKKGPLARIWLAAHWDKKLTKAHVFETNIDNSVDAILKPKVKMALRTSGHLLLGVVRIYSRKAKYLLADCNEAFVKIKMAFRPGVVDLPEENREAAVAAITLQENFHDFDTALADLEDIDVQAQFSVNQSRPEEITMREDLGNVTFVGDDGFGDLEFDDREILRDTTHLEESLYKNPDMSSHHINEDKDKTLDSVADKTNMDVDMHPAVGDDGFGGGFMDADDDDDDDFGDAGVDNEFFGEDFIQPGLFEDAPIGEVSMAPEVEAAGLPNSQEEKQTPESRPSGDGDLSEMAPPPKVQTSIVGEQTTLVQNEEEAFALEPLDVTSLMPGVERRTKRKRKLIVDEQKGIPSENMKLQLSDTSEIVTTLDLAPPTKKLMQWKETGGVEKLFGLPGRSIPSKVTSKLFSRNQVTKKMEEECEPEEDRLELEVPEVPREDDTRIAESIRPRETSTIVEESSIAADTPATKRARRSEKSTPSTETSLNSRPSQDMFVNTFNEAPVDLPHESLPLDPLAIDPRDLEDEPPSIAPFSVAPPSVPPMSVPPMSNAPAFEDLENEMENLEADEVEERQWNKRSQQMQHSLDIAFRNTDSLSFNELTRRHNRKQAASRFYTLLVLKKQSSINVCQAEPFGDIMLTKGPRFGAVF